MENPFSYLHYLAYGNSLKLKYDTAIDKNKLTIKWMCDNDEAVCKEITIVEDGKKINKIPFEEGKQQLVVYYQNKIVGNIQQIKKVKKQAHIYYLELIMEEEENMLKFKADIFGPAAASSAHLTANL